MDGEETEVLGRLKQISAGSHHRKIWLQTLTALLETGIMQYDNMQVSFNHCSTYD